MIAEITKTAAANFFSGTRSADAVQASDRPFEQFLTSRETSAPDRRVDAPQREDTDRRRTESNQPDRANRPDRPIRADDSNDLSGERESGIHAESVPPAEAVTDSPAEAPVADDAEEVLVDVLAEYLQIPADVIMQVLAELEIQLKDLADPVKANLFLQALLGKTPAELLNMPEYPQMVKNLSFVAAEILQQPAPETMTKISEALVQLGEFKTSLKADGQLVVELGKPAEELLLKENAAQKAQLPNQEAMTRESTAVQAPEQSENQASRAVPAASSGTAEAAVIPAEVMAEAPAESGDPQINSAALRAEVAALQAANSANALATPTRADPAQVMEQIMARVKLMPADNYQEVRITLRPESLGEVAMRIASRDGIVAAMFVAENQRVKEIIESNFNQLRDALKEQGIEVSSLHVSVGQDDAEEAMYQQMRAEQEAARRAARITQAGSEDAEEAPAQDAPALAMDGSTVDYVA